MAGLLEQMFLGWIVTIFKQKKMDIKIKEFEKRAIDAVSELRILLGATCIEVSIRVDNYEKSCRNNVTFYKSIPGDKSAVPGCGSTYKGD